METGTIYTLYTKALTSEEWLGAWAPVPAQLEWYDPESDTGLFRLTTNDLAEDDEYEFFQPGAWVLARRGEGEEAFFIWAGLLPA